MAGRRGGRAARHQHRAALTAAGGFGGACLAVGLPAVVAHHAFGAWMVWAVTFVVATLGVRGLIKRTRREPWRGLTLSAVLVGAAGWWILHGLALTGTVAAGLPLALAPAGVLACVVWLAPLRARQLRRVGWAIVATSLVTAALLVRSV